MFGGVWGVGCEGVGLASHSLGFFWARVGCGELGYSMFVRDFGGRVGSGVVVGAQGSGCCGAGRV